MSITARSFRFHARPRHAGLALVATFALVLTACGGGGGGGGNGGGTSDYTFKAAVVNETEGPIDVTLDTAGVPGDPTTLESCTATVVEYAIPLDDWTLTVGGQTAVDSLAMDKNLIDKNLIADITLKADGTIDLKRLAPGAIIGAPAAFGICN
jgi:hypothetical protein